MTEIEKKNNILFKNLHLKKSDLFGSSFSMISGLRQAFVLLETNVKMYNFF